MVHFPSLTTEEAPRELGHHCRDSQQHIGKEQLLQRHRLMDMGAGFGSGVQGWPGTPLLPDICWPLGRRWTFRQLSLSALEAPDLHTGDPCALRAEVPTPAHSLCYVANKVGLSLSQGPGLQKGRLSPPGKASGLTTQPTHLQQPYLCPGAVAPPEEGAWGWVAGDIPRAHGPARPPSPPAPFPGVR